MSRRERTQAGLGRREGPVPASVPLPMLLLVLVYPSQLNRRGTCPDDSHHTAACQPFTQHLLPSTCHSPSPFIRTASQPCDVRHCPCTDDPTCASPALFSLLHCRPRFPITSSTLLVSTPPNPVLPQSPHLRGWQRYHSICSGPKL